MREPAVLPMRVEPTARPTHTEHEERQELPADPREVTTEAEAEAEDEQGSI